MDSNNLGRYTVPTTPAEKAFFARHSGAITRYTISVVVIQAAWGFFSYNPAVALLRDGTGAIEWLSPYIPFIAAGILMILHKTLREETTEAFSNLVDKDDLTINRWWNYAIPVVVAVGLFILDFKGVSTTLRDTSFEGKKTTATAQSDSALNKAKSDYIMAITTIAGTRKDDSLSAVAPFKSRLQQAESIRTYDNLDVAAKNRKIASIKSERDAALVSVRKEASQAVKDALTTYKAEKTRITGIVDSTHQTLDGKDADNAANAESKGWYISTFFMLLFLLMTYKLVVLRTKAGIRINVQFTALDATGSFIEKLLVVITNLLQRQGHRLLVFTHKLGSVGTAELRDFDGNVVLKQSSYNGSKIAEPTPSVNIDNSDLNGDNGTVAPPPPPPLPPSSNGGGGDDDGRTPQLPAAPVPQNSIAQPQTATASAVATLPDGKFIAAAMADLGLSAKTTFSENEKEAIAKLASAYKNRESLNDTQWLTSFHEAGHAVAYFQYCVEKKIQPMHFKIEVNQNGSGRFVSFRTPNDKAWEAIINMAGFAAECYYTKSNRIGFFEEILVSHAEQPDIKKSFENVGDKNRVELAFQKAFEIMSNNNGCLNKIASELYEKKVLDYVDIINITKRFFKFSSPTPSVETSTTLSQTIVKYNKQYPTVKNTICTTFAAQLNVSNAILDQIFTELDTRFIYEMDNKTYVLNTIDLEQVQKRLTPTPAVETPVTPVTTPVTESNPAITEKPVTPPFTVTTPVTTVTTEKNEHGDKVLKEMKRGFQLEIGNITSKNGNYETVMKRIIRKNAEFDTAIKASFAKQLTVSPIVRKEITQWVADNVEPLILSYLNKEGTNE